MGEGMGWMLHLSGSGSTLQGLILSKGLLGWGLFLLVLCEARLSSHLISQGYEQDRTGGHLEMLDTQKRRVPRQQQEQQS